MIRFRRWIGAAGIEFVRPAIAWLSPLVVLLLAACDPCFGTGACTDPHVSGQGEVILHLTGAPASGARVEFRLESGVFAGPDTVWAEVDDSGLFMLRMPATGRGEVTGTMILHPPPPFQLFAFSPGRLTISTTTVSGDTEYLGKWGVGPLRGPPHISYVGELYYGDTNERAGGVEVEFRRTGGIAVRPDTFVVRSGSDGRFPLYMQPASEGTVRGDLYVRPSEPYQPLVIEGVEMSTTRGRDWIRLLGVWGLGR